MSTILTTPSGWTIEVNTGDHTFSDLLSCYGELGQEIPSRVELKGEVARVIEEGWEKYLALLDYLSYPKRRRGKYRRSLSRLIFDNDSSPDPVPLYLHEMEPLSRILNLPKNWEMFVLATEETPSERRAQHIRVQGVQTREFFRRRPIHRLVRPYRGNFVKMEHLPLAQLAEMESTDAYGALRHAALSAYYAGDRDLKDVRLEMIPWNELGMYSLSNQSLFTDLIRVWHRPSLNPSPNVEGLYERLLSKIPDDVDPWVLGLSSILYESPLPKNTMFLKIVNVYSADFCSSIHLNHVVAWINHTYLTASVYRDGTSKSAYTGDCTYISRRRKSMLDRKNIVSQMTAGYSWDVYRAASSVFYGIPGRKGLEKMIKSLNHHKNAYGSSKVVESFLESANDYLNGTRDSRPYHKVHRD